ncbi:MAG: hypothetical protein H6999_09300 [Hahellaceae bacterium]|nr:hypothetical protein [Hahellaceae bacterium]
MKHSRLLIPALLGIAVTLTGYFSERAPQPALPAQAESMTPSTQVSPATQAKMINDLSYEHFRQGESLVISAPLPASLQGIASGVTLGTDDNGNLIINESIKELFEFYLSALGEESLELLLQRIRADIAEQLQPPALDQASQLLKNYVDYKIELASLPGTTPSASNTPAQTLALVKARKQQVNQMRQHYFSPGQYEAFFAEEDQYDTYMVNHLSISGNPDLSQDAKAEQLLQLEQSLPESIRKVRQQTSRYGDLYQTTQQMRANGASDAEIYALRANTLDDNAAMALATLDQQQAQWQQRLKTYASERNQIRDSGLSQTDQTLAINTLIEQMFSGTERLRVRALDQDI